jgi:sulfatase modifying factor 1
MMGRRIEGRTRHEDPRPRNNEVFMRAKGLLIPVVLSVFFLCSQAWSSSPWLSLPSDERGVVRRAVVDELNKRKTYSTPQEDTALWKLIEDEKNQGDDLYRENLDKARLSFIRAKNTRDDLVAQVRSLSADSDDTLRQIRTIRATIEDIDNSLIRWTQDMKTHQKSFETWLSTEKRGSVLVAVTYTADVKDTQHALDLLADRASVSVLAGRTVTDKQSFVKALDGVLTEGFIRGMTDGAFVGDREKTLLVAVAKDARGVTYLRLKRHDFFPFQRPKSEPSQTKSDSSGLPAVVISSLKEMDEFLKKTNHSLGTKDAKQADFLIRDTIQENIQAEESLSGQVRSFREKTASLQKNIADSRSDYDTWAAALKKQESRYEPMRQTLDKIRVNLEAAERSFKESWNALQEKMRFQETIIPIRDAAFLKGSQTPAETAAGAIANKMAEVKNDAEAQYFRHTKEALHVLMTDEKVREPAEADSRIVGVKLLSFVGEGDIVRIKAAFRVRTALKEETPPERKEALTDPTKVIELVLIKGGCFQKGDAFGDGQADEQPVHTVCVDDFYIGKYEVTQGQWQSVMGSNPSFFKKCGEKCPVEQVSWNDVQGFITKLNAKTGKKYRLPTEAEWEYAARSGGKKEKYAGTSSDVELGKYAWYSANSGGRTHPTGERQPNGLGLYDMTGNVWEWCQDWYGEKYYSQSSRKNPTGPASGTRRVLRGGAWIFEPAGIRASARYSLTPDARGDLYGFRLSISVSR